MLSRDGAQPPGSIEPRSYVLLLAPGGEDPAPWALRCLADRFRAEGAIVLVACDQISAVARTPEERRPALRALASETNCWVVAPRDGATLVDATELIDALHSIDGPMGFDPSVLPFQREWPAGAAGIAEVCRIAVGRVPRLDGGETALWVHFWLERERPLDTYNEICERYALEVPEGLPWWVSVSMLGDADAAERASVLVFR